MSWILYPYFDIKNPVSNRDPDPDLHPTPLKIRSLHRRARLSHPQATVTASKMSRYLKTCHRELRNFVNGGRERYCFFNIVKFKDSTGMAL